MSTIRCLQTFLCVAVGNMSYVQGKGDHTHARTVYGVLFCCRAATAMVLTTDIVFVYTFEQ